VTKKRKKVDVMDNDFSEYYAEVTNYVAERAIAEGSVPLYLRENYDDKRSIYELVYAIVMLSDQFMDLAMESDDIFIDEDERDFVAERTGYSENVIKLIIWFKECYQMMTDCITYTETCPQCGHKEMFAREKDLYEANLECCKCKRVFEFGECMDIDD